MSKKIVVALLAGIILFGALLRFYRLGDNGLGFFRDEAALGLNAWSLLSTGADEYGQKFPLIFRSFEVFFLPAYVYLSLPIFFLLGPTVIAARTLSAISGTLLILTSFLIAKEFFKSGKVAFISALLVAVSPWAIFYSRGAFEGNLALLAFSVGVYLWLKFTNTDKKKYFFLSLVFFVFSMSSYQAPRFVAPLFVGVSILSQKFWWKKWKLWIFGFFFAA
ncbi:glycosyltransferase family 39 protein, partial [Candidatus Woesebacteria bacterium]|nr:glycosyltransferase family 39 protein [Candidatus Woesebacteria bacterium]